MSEAQAFVLDETSRDRFGPAREGLRERLRRLRVRFHPPRRLYPTKAGLFTLGVPIVLGVAAVNAGNNLLFILLALSLALILLSGLLSERNLAGLEVRVQAAAAAFAGEPARLLIQLRQPPGRARARFGIRVAELTRKHWPERGAPLDQTVGLVERESLVVLGERTFSTRGEKRFKSLELSTRYPFGLFRKVRDVDADAAVLVWPRRVSVPEVLARPETMNPEGRASRRRGLGLDVYGLREREEWDPELRVHALRSSMLGRDVVIETEAAVRPEAWLGLDNGPGADPAALERAIEIAASTLAAWNEAGYAVGLETATELWSPGELPPEALLDRLAVIGPAATPPAGVRAQAWLVPKGGAGPAAPTDVLRFEVEADGRLHSGGEA